MPGRQGRLAELDEIIFFTLHRKKIHNFQSKTDFKQIGYLYDQPNNKQVIILLEQYNIG